jgi:hypothetical protein
VRLGIVTDMEELVEDTSYGPESGEYGLFERINLEVCEREEPRELKA